jgi:alanyl-tRNA synthetase
MLGNFSFGDYFKKDAINVRLDLPHRRAQAAQGQALGHRLRHATTKPYDIWTQDVGVPAERMIRIGDNKGAHRTRPTTSGTMGDTGPCGPCTEIFYDHGA